MEYSRHSAEKIFYGMTAVIVWRYFTRRDLSVYSIITGQEGKGG
jgi:hypothetical protein